MFETARMQRVERMFHRMDPGQTGNVVRGALGRSMQSDALLKELSPKFEGVDLISWMEVRRKIKPSKINLDWERRTVPTSLSHADD